MRLSEFKVLTFDCYGTLIDWETGILQALAPLRAKDPAARTSDEVLADFARHESAQEAETPGMAYSALLGRVHRRLAEEWNVAAGGEEHARFGASVGDWPAFADSAAALAYLKEFYKLVVLSNVDRASFARSGERLGVAFDAVYTAEEIGSYKPDPRNFRYMLDRLAGHGFAAGDILHTAQSLYHDHAPANTLGLHSAWIDRRGAKPGSGATPAAPAGVRWDFRFTGMAEFAAAHRTERSR